MFVLRCINWALAEVPTQVHHHYGSSLVVTEVSQVYFTLISCLGKN